ncbi:MAG TPA: hypothetical protein VIT65_02880 [Microlunatus sp.]
MSTTASSTPSASAVRPTVVVIAAPPGPLAGVRDALRDWSALGFVTDFLWVETRHLGSSDSVPAELISHGTSTAVVLEHTVEEQQLGRLRLAVLVPALRGAEPMSPAAEDRIAAVLRSAGGGVRTQRLRLVITRPDSGPGTATPARPEWHNLVISPEDGQGPGRGLVQLMPTLDAVELGSPAAATICGVTGLWTGLPEAPLDDLSPPPGTTVRVVRAFHRRLDAGAVDDRVRAGVGGMTNGLPRPRTGGTRSVASDDPERDTTQAAQLFWQRRSDVLDSGQVKADPIPVPPIKLGQALKMFLTFLAATVVNAVPRWYHGVVYRINVDVARRAQSALFGTDPAAYAVMVNGVRADSDIADWRDLLASSQQLEDALGQQTELASAQPGRARLGGVWRDLVGAALTLADAGDHPGEMAPLQRGIDRAFVADPAMIAPGAAAAFPDLPSYLPSIGPDGLRPTDALSVETTIQRLRVLAQQPGAGADADRTLNALRDWSARYAGTFTVRVGAQLADAVRRHTSSVRALLGRLAEAAEAGEPDTDLQRRQRRLALLMRVLMAVLVVVLAVVVVLGVKDLVEPVDAVLIGGAAVIVWFVGTAAAFIVQQRNLFAALHRRRQAASDAEVNQRNLAIALGDLRRTSQAYGEFLEWSRIIAVVLAQPFGGVQSEIRPPLTIGDGMPRSVRVGVAQPDPAVLDEVIEQLRTDRYRFGWLGPIWDDVLGDAPRRLGPAARALREDAGLMYAESAGDDQLLTRWADRLEAEGTGSAAGDAMWQSTLAQLEATQLGDSLLTTVLPADGGRAKTLEDFMAGIGDDRSPTTTEFDYAVFRRQAQVAGRAAVSSTRGFVSTADGLAKAAVTVQFSDGIPAYELSWTPDGRPPPPDPDHDAPPPPPSGLDEFDQDF